ncbi:MAG: hypothetical protein IT352_14765 [Gemmatimonadales bacterium]|nr:hypothetical protein [Gemmatimonadales bacterium]
MKTTIATLGFAAITISVIAVSKPAASADRPDPEESMVQGCVWYAKYYESPGGGVVCYGGSGSECVACKN